MHSYERREGMAPVLQGMSVTWGSVGRSYNTSTVADRLWQLSRLPVTNILSSNPSRAGGEDTCTASSLSRALMNDCAKHEGVVTACRFNNTLLRGSIFLVGDEEAE